MRGQKSCSNLKDAQQLRTARSKAVNQYIVSCPYLLPLDSKSFKNTHSTAGRASLLGTLLWEFIIIAQALEWDCGDDGP